MNWYTQSLEKVNAYSSSKLPWYRAEQRFARDMQRHSFVQVESVQPVNSAESDDDQSILYFKHYSRLLEIELEAADMFGVDNPATTVHLSIQTKSYVETLKRAYEEKKRLHEADRDNFALEIALYKYAAAYHAAEILFKIKEFELAAYKYKDSNKSPQQLLAELNTYVTTHKDYLYINRFTGNVLTKLVQVQSRMNEQFGKTKYDKERSKNGLSAIINNFTTTLNDFHANDEVSKKRLSHIQKFSMHLQSEDIQQYTPGFFGKIGRWFASIFSSSSWFVNHDNPKKIAWSDLLADIRHAVIPSFLSKGSDGVKRELELGSLSKKFTVIPQQKNVAAAPQNIAANEVSALYRGYKNKLDDLLGSNANGLGSFEENSNEVKLKKEQQHFIIHGPLANTFTPSIAEHAEQLPSSDIFTQNDEYATAAFPEWPAQQISSEIIKNPEELKKYTDKVAACVSYLFVHDNDNNHEEITRFIAKVMMPAILTMYDVLTIKLDWTTSPNNFVGLEFYKQILAKLFKMPLQQSLQFVVQPETDGDTDNIKFWKRLYALHTQCLNHYDPAKKLYRKCHGETFTDIPTNENGETTEEGKALLLGFIKSISHFNDIAWNQLKIPVLNSTQNDLRGFYGDFATLRHSLRRYLLDSQKYVVLNEEKDTPLNIIQKDLNCSAIVKLLAVLNSFAHQFNLEVNKAESNLAEYFGNSPTAAGPVVAEILAFINNNKDTILSVYTGSSQKELDDTLRNIFNLLRDMNNPYGTKYKETINSDNKVSSNTTVDTKQSSSLLSGLFGLLKTKSSSPPSSPDTKSAHAKKAAVVEQVEERKVSLSAATPNQPRT